MPASPTTQQRAFLFCERRVRGRRIDRTRGPVVRASSAQVRGDLLCSSVMLSLGGVAGSDPESGAFGKRSLSKV